MKLFKLDASKTSYNQFDSLLVRAESAEKAKEIAGEYARKLDAAFLKRLYSCEEISQSGEPGVVMTAYCAG